MRSHFLAFIFSIVTALTSACAMANTVFYLSSTPEEHSDCYNVDISACRAIDGIQASGYAMARRGQMTWVQMVERYYRERSRIFPYMRDNHVTAEIRAYQRVLAERKDAGKITESEWVFLLSRQNSAIVARENQSKGIQQQQQQIQQLQNNQANFEQQQQMYQSTLEQQRQMQQQQIDQQRMQQQQLEQQQTWQRMQVR